MTWCNGIVLALLGLASIGGAHRISMSAVAVNVQENRVLANMKIMLEDLVMYHGVQAGAAQRFAAEDLKHAAAQHGQFVQQYFTLHNAAGQPVMRPPQHDWPSWSRGCRRRVCPSRTSYRCWPPSSRCRCRSGIRLSRSHPAPEAEDAGGTRALAAGRAAQQPVLAVWEDLHWADPSTLELLELLLDHVPTARLLLVLTCQTGFRPPWAPRSYVTPLTLPRLPRPQNEGMVCG